MDCVIFHIKRAKSLMKILARYMIIKKIAYCFAIASENMKEVMKIIDTIPVRIGFHIIFLKYIR